MSSISEKINKAAKLVNNYHYTHLQRILYAEQGITKEKLAYYYATIAESILPYITDRPLSLVRCPKGQQQKCFYQKHSNDNFPKDIYSVKVTKNQEIEEYIYIKDLQGLLALVQLDTLEIHAWGARCKNLDHPDQIIFDLDPAPEVEWKRVINAAQFVRENLENLQLKSFVKTSGNKGFHIVIPIKPEYSWEQVKTFATHFAKSLAQIKPEDFIAVMNKSKRKNKIFIDFLRNQKGATTVAPYSTRAKPNVSISTPLAWNELSVKKTASYYQLNNIYKRLAALKQDPWQNYFKVKQGLPNY